MITARPPDPVGNAAFSTELIGPDQLRVTPDLDQALREVPGLSFFRSNSSLSAYPARLGPSLRSLIGGSGVSRALVTLDGVPQIDPFGGWIIPTSLPVEELQLVEIVRGAGAGPYGAGALTGVIEISENDTPGALIDAERGSPEAQRYVALGNVQRGSINIGASGTYQKSGGWYAIDPAHRGAIDTPVGLEATNLSAHASAEVLEGTLLAVRFGAYDERRAAGIAGIGADAKGVTGSATIAHPEAIGALGWRGQVWFRDFYFAVTQASVPPGRATEIPATDEYSTPALGWGGNAALRGTFTLFDWESGADIRFNEARRASCFLTVRACSIRAGFRAGEASWAEFMAKRLQDLTAFCSPRVCAWMNGVILRWTCAGALARHRRDHAE